MKLTNLIIPWLWLDSSHFQGWEKKNLFVWLGGGSKKLFWKGGGVNTEGYSYKKIIWWCKKSKQNRPPLNGWEKYFHYWPEKLKC